MLKCVRILYVVFGDEPRSDGDNIYGIFTHENTAQQIMEDVYKHQKPWIDFHIEEFALWE